MRRVTYMNESRHVWMCHVAYMEDWMGRLTYVNESSHMRGWVMSRIFGSAIAHIRSNRVIRMILLVVCACNTGWRRPIGCLKLQVTFRNRATNYRALLQKMTYKDKASYGSWLPCIKVCAISSIHNKYLCNFMYAHRIHTSCDINHSRHFFTWDMLRMWMLNIAHTFDCTGSLCNIKVCAISSIHNKCVCNFKYIMYAHRIYTCGSTHSLQLIHMRHATYVNTWYCTRTDIAHTTLNMCILNMCIYKYVQYLYVCMLCVGYDTLDMWILDIAHIHVDETCYKCGHIVSRIWIMSYIWIYVYKYIHTYIYIYIYIYIYMWISNA